MQIASQVSKTAQRNDERADGISGSLCSTGPRTLSDTNLERNFAEPQKPKSLTTDTNAANESQRRQLALS